MKNNKFLFSVLIITLITVTLFSACKSKQELPTTTSQNTQPVTSMIHATDYTYRPIETESKEEETKYIHTVPPIPSQENKTEKKTNIAKTTENATFITTKKHSSRDKIDEINMGLSLITKTSPVDRGNSATIIIHGTPGSKYAIEFYKNNSEKADYRDLKELTADSSGFVSWTFTVENDCEPGDRKIIVREKNTNKLIQTSITVQ